MLFNYDWWFDGAFARRMEEAKSRCAKNHFPELDLENAATDEAYKDFFDELEARTIVYLRDGFSYEIKEIIQRPTTSALTFECMPADEAYKVGCFVVTLPFDDIVRVEIFAVHPDEKPEDMPSIKGFAGAQGPPPPPGRGEERAIRRDRCEPEDPPDGRPDA
jgi:hypothetical protein